MRKTLIIAEAGVNHNGSLKMAEELANEQKKQVRILLSFRHSILMQLLLSMPKWLNIKEKILGK